MKKIIYIAKRLVLYLSLLPSIFILQSHACFAQISVGDNYVRTRTYIHPTSTQSNASSIEDINYLDGFGRVIQSIAVNAIPTQNRDVITPFEYGVHGRTEKSYLPYVKTGNNGKYDSNWSVVSNWGTYGVEEQAYAFGKIEYDNSPLNKVIKETGAGAAWHTNAKGVVTSYKNNSSNRTYKWQVSSNGDLVNAGYYPANAFIVIDKLDEDGIWTQTCVDSEGRVILDILIVDGVYWDTYYVYDMRGNLSYILPPEASARISSGAISTATLNEYAYCYKYDEWGRLIEKKLPGNALIYYVYDKYDNVVLTQDGNQRIQTERLWDYYLYDSKNRLIEKGFVDFSNVYSREELQRRVDLMDTFSLGDEKRMVYDVYMYDNYKNYHAFLAESGYSSSFYPLVTGELTCRRVMDLSTDAFLFETYYYDDKMRLIQVIANNHMGGISRTSMAYDFTGNLIKTKERHTRTGATEDVLETTFTYDSRGRLLNEKAVLNNAGTMEVAYTYDLHDRVLTKTYGNNAYTETFSYNIRSWLTSIDGNLFSQKLRYTNPQIGSKALYSGNISEWDWGQSTASKHAYGFEYDNAGRLKDASFYEKSGVNWIKNNKFNEQNITYDKHGNIKTLTRTQEANVQTFNYTYSGNRLVSLAGSLAGNYEYDYNGNLIKDSRRGFTLSYNRLNLLNEVKSGNTLLSRYSHRSDGIKQGVKDGSGKNGFDYLGFLTYKASNGVTELEGALTSVGMIVKTANTYESLYHLKDHLGSVRAVWNATKKVAVEFNDYYPFGKTHRRSDHIKSDNRYGYNGKEEQVVGDLGYLDYGARMYDTELGRWLGVDPMAEDSISLSPYNYVLNNPARYTDFWGLFPGQNEPPAAHYMLPEFTVTAPGPLFWGSIMAEWEFAGTWSQYIGLYPEFKNLNADEAQKLWREKYSTLYFDWWEASVKAEKAAQTTQQLVWFMKAFTSIGTVVAPGGGLKGGGSSIAKSSLSGSSGITVSTSSSPIPSLGAGRIGVKNWLKNVHTLGRGQLIKDIESVGFKKIHEGGGIMKFNRGKMTIRLDPPQGKTLYNHMHLNYGKGNKNTYDIFLRPINFKHPGAHIPIK